MTQVSVRLLQCIFFLYEPVWGCTLTTSINHYTYDPANIAHKLSFLRGHPDDW